MDSNDPLLTLLNCTIYEYILGKAVLMPSGCREWRGMYGKANKKNSYGSVLVDGRDYPVHRWIIFNTPGNEVYDINDSKLFACHHCDNPPCIEPTHLIIATCKWNSLDLGN